MCRFFKIERIFNTFFISFELDSLNTNKILEIINVSLFQSWVLANNDNVKNGFYSIGLFDERVSSF